jgi:hypothetical protein
MNSTIVDQEALLKFLPALTLRQLRRLRSQRKIPFLKLGHHTFLYDVDAVVEALKKLEVSK